MSKTTMSPMKMGRGTAPRMLGLQPGAKAPAGRERCAVVLGSGMFLFVFPKG